VWRNTAAESDGYVLGIEPGTNYPNPRSFEQQHGRVVTLKPGEKWSAMVTASWHSETASIAAEEKAIAAIQADKQPKVSAQPLPEWSK
jgi:hypothetical protein